MRAPMQLRLFLSSLIVLLLGMMMAGGLAWLSVEHLYIENLRENLLAQANLTAVALQDAPLPANNEPYLQASNLQPGIHTRLLANQDGVVINLPLEPGDAQIQVPPADEMGFVSPDVLSQRQEIQSALQGKTASTIRQVTTAGSRRVMYAAAPVFASSGEITGIVYLAAPLPLARLPAYILIQLAGAAGIAVLLAGFVGAILSRRIARPVEALYQAANAVAGGDLEQQVPADSNILELSSLGQAFNSMTASLRRSDQAKNAFIADVTHELRTPLTVIKGTVETLEDGALDDPEGRDALLVSMHRETDRLIRLVNDLLVLARADAGALHLQFQQVDLAGLAQARCESLTVLATPRGITLVVEAAEPMIVCSDADRITQVLDNLLENALRHAPQDTMVCVSVLREGNEMRCSVTDQGPGIPARHLPFIFERFYRADAARDRHSGGSGLGLAIVRSLVQALGGRITAHSIEGQGTEITFWLPADANCHPAA